MRTTIELDDDTAAAVKLLHAQEHRGVSEAVNELLNGQRRVGLPWISLSAFLGIATNPRASVRPLSPTQAWDIIEGWLNPPASSTVSTS